MLQKTVVISRLAVGDFGVRRPNCASLSLFAGWIGVSIAHGFEVPLAESAARCIMSYRNAPSQSFLLTSPPSIISARISVNKALRHGLRRSSAGTSNAKMPSARSMRYVLSCSCCWSDDNGPLGAGKRAVCGSSVEYRIRSSAGICRLAARSRHCRKAIVVLNISRIHSSHQGLLRAFHFCTNSVRERRWLPG